MLSYCSSARYSSWEVLGSAAVGSTTPSLLLVHVDDEASRLFYFFFRMQSIKNTLILSNQRHKFKKEYFNTDHYFNFTVIHLRNVPN